MRRITAAITTAASALILASSAPAANASTASASVEGPETVTFTMAKNFIRGNTPEGWSIGGCRRVSKLAVRCSTYEASGERHVAAVRFTDRFSITLD